MCNRDSFETLLGFGNAGESLRFEWRTLEAMGIAPELPTRLGLFREVGIGSTVECRACERHVPVLPRETNGGVELFADCPECGVFPLMPFEQKFWQLDYTPLLEAARMSLRCSGAMSEPVSDALWNLGRAALAGQSRSVFVCAGINSVKNAEIRSHLPPGRTPVLLVIGDLPRPGKLDGFPADNIFQISTLAAIEDGEIKIDVAAISSQLGIPIPAEPAPRPPRKNSIIGDLIVKLKTELRQYMLGNYSAYLQAERSNREYELPQLRQIDLAVMFKVDKSYITRAMAKDRELKILFESAGSLKATLAYGSKAVR